MVWEEIAQYERIIKARGYHGKHRFRFYDLEGQLGWSNYDSSDGRPCIHPQDVRVSSATRGDIGEILSQILAVQAKIPPIPGSSMAKQNRSTVKLILTELQGR